MALTSYLFALGANLCFGFASLVFSEYSKKVSVYWVNYFKAIVASIACALSLFIANQWHMPDAHSFMLFFSSGIIGLMIGDIFLLKAFVQLGPGRSMMLYGFHPILTGIGSYYLFEQEVGLQKFMAIIFFIGCLYSFSLEIRVKTGAWEVKGLILAGLAIFLDAMGVLITKAAFQVDVEVLPMQGNLFRSLGASFGFLLLSFLKPIGLVKNFRLLSQKGKVANFSGALSGTYLSLFLYLSAIQIGHIATISAITMTAPFFASLFECIYKKELPSKHMLISILLFAIGILVLFY